MNSLQIELDKINQQLELLTYRKNQLDSIMGEYSDVINRVKNLVLSMEDANVEPSNLLMEIETLIHCPEPEPVAPEPDSNHEKINSYIIPFDPLIHGETEPELTPEPTPEPTAEPTAEPQQHFDFDLRLFPKTNSLGLPVSTPEPTPENDDDNDCDTDGLDDEDYGFDDDEIEESEPEPEQRGNSLLFQPNIYWDNGSSMRVFIPKKRRYKGELEAIVKDCIEQGLAERYDLNECGTDWIIGLAPVTSEDTVKRIIGEFYPVHTDGEPDTTPEPTPQPSNPELLKIMALVPVVTPEKIQQAEPLEPSQSNSSNGYKPDSNTINNNQGVCNQQNQDSVTVVAVTNVKNEASTPAPKTQLNERAWRRGDTLLIGFTNKRLLNQWEKWVKGAWGDSVKTWSDETLDGFTHCLSVLWYGSSKFIDWERLSSLNYSFKPDEQPTGIKLDDVRDVILTLQNSGVKFISKGELLAHHLNSLKASDLEDYLEKLAEEGLIILGNKSIDLCVKPSEQNPDSPTFEYEQVDEKTTKIYADGVLLGLAKDCGTHWESPQFKGETFPNRRDVVNALWELVNKF